MLMKLIIIAVGKEKDFEGRELVADYSARISQYAPIEWRYVEPSNARGEGIRICAIADKLGAGTYMVALDEKGKEYDSTAFADFIQSRMNESVRFLVIVIGGSYGLDASVRDRAQSTIALSKLTFPHQLVRLILAEQLYRACTIIKGEKYHH